MGNYYVKFWWSGIFTWSHLIYFWVSDVLLYIMESTLLVPLPSVIWPIKIIVRAIMKLDMNVHFLPLASTIVATLANIWLVFSSFAMLDIFQEAGLPLWLRPYEVLVTSSYTALIETIPDTVIMLPHKYSRIYLMKCSYLDRNLFSVILFSSGITSFNQK